MCAEEPYVIYWGCRLLYNVCYRSGAPLVRLEMLPVSGGSFTFRHTNPLLLPLRCAFGPPGYASRRALWSNIQAYQPPPEQRVLSLRCAFGPPGNASYEWRIPHIQAHQPPPEQRLLSLRGWPGASLTRLEMPFTWRRILTSRHTNLHKRQPGAPVVDPPGNAFH